MGRVIKGLSILMAVLTVAYLGMRFTLNAPDEGGLTPLHFAALKGDADKLSLLLLIGGRPDARTPDGVTPLHLAMAPDVVTVLRQRGANLNARTDNNEAPLHFAVRAERPDVVQRFLALEADVNVRNGEKETPLHLAAAIGDARAAALLLNHGADPLLRDIDGLTPRQVALRANHADLAQALATAERVLPEGGHPARE
jgi:ankyrin repeat protein